MDKPRILIVEDERLVAEDIRRILHDLGYFVSAIAKNERETIEKLKEESTDLILMDIVLHSERSGIEIARRIRSHFDIPVVFLTAYADERTVNAVKQTEPYGYLVKPLNPKELQTTIEMALYKHSREKKSGERHGWLAAFLDRATDTFCLLDRDLRINKINGAGIKNLGLKKKDILGKNFLDFIPRQERSEWLEKLHQVIEKGKPFLAEDLAIPSELGERFVNIKAFKGSDGLGLVISEVTDKKKMEQALKESEDRYRMIVENMNEGIVMVDKNSVIMYVNNKYLEMMGYGRGEMLGHSLIEFLDSHFIDRYKHQTFLEDDKRRRLSELVWRKSSGKIMISLVSPSPVYDEKRNFKGHAIVVTDITERRRVEEELSRSREELRNLSQHLHSIRENECKRIAREIHDELGQTLTALKMDISWISQKLPQANKEKRKLAAKINSMSEIIDMTIQTVQKLSAELRPGLLDDLGLGPAIEWLGQDFQKRTGVRCNISLKCDDFFLGSECSTAIFRVVQEALTNVARHARASRVSLKLGKQRNNLKLEIRDNGRGIREEEALAPESLGIIGMRERLHPFEGMLKVRGEPERGTTVSIVIPLGKASED